MKAITGMRLCTWVVGCVAGALVHAQALVGRTTGEAGVSATGAARYAAPLSLPAGTNGLAPALTVLYDSRGGHGLLGAGFQLGGFSVVQRCGRTLAQDGVIGAVALDAGDRYCLDGKRLRLTLGTHGLPGSQYQTEIEEFSRVTAFGTAGVGPAYFQVETRDGLVYQYGATSDSRVESVGSTTPRSWALNRIRDRSGNYVDFSYVEDTVNGSHRPHSIAYAGNSTTGAAPYYSVRFVYEPRPASDLVTTYVAGGPTTETQRLDRIDVTHVASGTLVRRFEFAYAPASSSGRSRLASLQECSGSACLPATRFDWVQRPLGWSWWDTGTSIDPAHAKAVMPGDMDGDGYEDFTYFDTASGRWIVLRGNAMGYAAPAVNAAPGTASTAVEAVSIDLDGDGKRDVLMPGFSMTLGATWFWLHHTAGSTYLNTPTNIANVSVPGGAIAADIDGDGREDLVYARKNSTSIFWRRSLTAGGVPSFAAEAVLWNSPYAASTPAAPFGTDALRFRSSVRRGDFNGDRRTDLLFMQQYNCGTTPGCFGTRTEWHALVSQGAALASRAVFVANVMPLLGDFNGDGLTDVMASTVAFDGSVSWAARLATGAASAAASPFAAPFATSIAAPESSATVVDWDGDGRTDVLYPTAESGWQYCRSTGTAFAECAEAGAIAESFSGAPMPTDINGDGVADIVYPATDWRYRLRHPGQRDLLSSVTDGLGNSARFSYKTLADRSVHTPRSGAVFPVREFSEPLQVVSQVVRSDGVGGTFNTSMTYEGARVHVQGRGFLGFARRTATDARTGLARVEDSLQDAGSFEAVGLPAVVTLRQANGQPLDRRTFTWTRKDYGTGTELRRFAHPSTIVADRYELDGTRVASSAINAVFDGFGALTDYTLTVTEVARGSNAGAQHVRRVSTGVMNDTTYWCLGRPISVVERRSHTLAGGAEIARTRGKAWDAARCRPTQETVEPFSATLKVTSDLAYDAYGNLATEAVTPMGQPVRRTDLTWVDSGRFLGTVSAPEAHAVNMTWSPVFAQRMQVKDPNGLVTQFQYDGLDRIVRQIRPDGTSRAVARIPCGGSTCAWPGAAYVVRESQLGAGGGVVRTDEMGLDAFERPVYLKQEQPGGSHALSVQRFNARGLTSQLSVPEACCTAPSRWATYTYDALGRVLSRERPVSQSDSTLAATRYRYDGFNVVQTDALGRASTQRTDTLGNILQTVDAAGADTDYEYDAFGNLLKVRDFAGTETSLAYNTAGMRTRLVDPDAGTWTFAYSALGELTSQTNARGQATTYAYDLLGRPLTRTEPEGVTSWIWGHSAASRHIGSLSAVTSPGFQESYAYDALGRPAGVTRTVAGASLVTSFAYDAVTGLLGTLTYPTVPGVAPFRLQHVQDRGRLSRLVDADDPATVFWKLDTLNPAGQVAAATLGNGVKVSSTFDAVTGLPTSRTAGPGGGTALQNLAYGWDVAGNLRNRTDANRNLNELFSYDLRDRLDYVTRGGVTALDLAYDDLGNITFKSDIGSYRYDPVRRHAVVSAGANTYSYDANGAVTRASGSAISWFSYDLPSQITHPNGNYSAFYYGPDRARYRQVARAGTSLTDTLYAMDGRYERYSRGGVTYERQYIAADGHIVAVRNRAGSAAPTLTYVLQDHLGSTDAFASSSGSLLARASYQPLGARRSGDGSVANPTTAEWQQIAAATPRGYTGHEHLDNLGVIHMNGRVFDPVLGRFLSPDPVVQAPYDGQSLNRYSYVRNNPLRYTDPSGHCFNGHPAADQFEEDCLEQIFVNAFGLGNYGSAFWDSIAQGASMAQVVGDAGSVPAGDLAAANSASPEFVVTASRIDPPAMFAVDASMYAPLPAWFDRAAQFVGGLLSPESLLVAVMTAAVVEPTPIGEGVVVVVTASSSRALVPYYPLNNGFFGSPVRTTLQPGQVIDRFGGSRYSRFFSPEGTPARARSLPPGAESQALRRFEVRQPLTVESGSVAPAFGQLGFGVQYRTHATLDELVEQGVIREIGP